MINHNKMPDKIFGIESGLIIEFLPLVGLVILFFASLNLVIIPKIEAASEINTKRVEVEKEANLLRDKTNYLLSVDQEDLKMKSDLLANTLIKEKNSYFLVQAIKEIGAKYGFQVMSFSVAPGKVSGDEDNSPGKKIGDVQKQPVTITLMGPSVAYVDLISGLEKSIPILSLDKMDVKNGANVSEIDLVVSAYYSEAKIDRSISKLTLADLTLTKSENELIKKLDSFQLAVKAGDLGEGNEQSEGGFTKYNRQSPFSL